MERRHTVHNREINYEGLFDFYELFKLVDGWFKDSGYDKREKENYERLTPTGKYVKIELRPWKKITDYVRLEIRLEFFIHDMVDKVVNIDGVKKKLKHGKVLVKINSYTFTDYEGRWEGRGWYYFVRTFFEKFVYRKQMDKFEEILVADTNEVIKEMTSFLNLERY